MKKSDLIFTVVSLAFGLAGIVFLCVSIFGNSPDNKPLMIALACVCAGSLANTVRLLNNRKKNFRLLQN